MPPKKLLSILLAAGGIAWYSYQKQAQLMGKAAPAESEREGGARGRDEQSALKSRV